MNKSCAAFAAGLMLLTAVHLGAVENATLFRVFLNDGTAVVSYGEFARVGDRVVFSMPIGEVDAASGAAPALHLVNLPADAVNWPATSQYAESARFAHYIATNAEADYAALTGEVAEVLNSIVYIKDPAARLEQALQARRRLATWPRDHYGYRSDDVRQVLAMLDEAIADLRAAAGQTAFALDLVATAPEPPQPPPVMASPTAAETIKQALAVAKASDISADRISLLNAVVGAIDDPRNAVPSDWAKSTRKWAVGAIQRESRVDKAYGQLAAESLRDASQLAARADVRGIERVLDRTQKSDSKLGGQRPDLVSPLVAQIQLKLDAARRLRLARDQWREQQATFRVYQRAITPALSLLAAAQAPLEDIKKLAGNEAGTLISMAERLDESSRRLNALTPPAELKACHAMLLSAANLASTAVRTRRQAVVSGEIQAAWDASAAAAGSMLLFSKAQEDLEATMKLPQLR